MSKAKPHDKNPDLEYPDQTPLHIPGKTDLQPPLSLRDEMMRYIREQVNLQAEAQRMESFEEAEDFEVDEEPDLTTGYTVKELITPEGIEEVQLDPPSLPAEPSLAESKENDVANEPTAQSTAPEGTAPSDPT